MRKPNKMVWVCPNCDSDNVQIREWVNPNTSYTDDSSELDDEDYWCNDCQSHKILTTKIVAARTKVIGFQVLFDSKKVRFHPSTKPDEVYSLEQARDLLNSSHKLKAVWSCEIETPVMMFTGNMRD